MADNFTKFQIKALQKEFQKYDENGDNSMTTKVIA
jgi:Ca2+-binding EF-hand superfamily protein